MPGNDVIHPICDRWGRLRNFDFCSTIEPAPTWPYMLWINPEEQRLRVRDAQDDDWITIGGSGGGGAPTGAPYLVLALSPDLTAERRLVIGDGLQGTDAGPNGDYTLAVKVADFAGTGLENDGSNNLRIAAAAAGDGLTGGGGDPLAVDSTVVRTSGDQTIAGVKTFQNDIILDDGAGDSPQIQLVSGSNDDTVYIFLEDDAVACNSDLIIKLAGGGSVLDVVNSGGDTLWLVDSNGDHQVMGTVTITDDTLPLQATVEDAKTDAVSSAARLEHFTSGTAAAGFGVRLGYWLEDDGGDLEPAATIDASWLDPTSGSEDSQLSFHVRGGGMAPAPQVHIADGKLYPDQDVDVDLGDSTHRWKNFYANIINSKVFMGIVNGGHSDFASAQVALNWAVANGYLHVYFPPGTYGNITIGTESMTIEGSGANTIFEDTAGHCVQVSQRRITLKNFAVLGSPGGGNGYDCIHVDTNKEGCFIHGILFRESDRYGLYSDGDNVTMTGCIFRTVAAFDSNKIYLDTNSDRNVIVGNAFLEADVVDHGTGNMVADNS